ncbi:MAG TPA: hypothetical protein VFS43_40815 [Polyangiaceae bacterium]|nr:hypothetical protein [Polyangiaceae bacterium]
MTKKNAAKSAARARQEKHGGKYMHHRRVAEGGPQEPFERLVHDFIRLAQARYDEYRAANKVDWYSLDVDEMVDEVLKLPLPAEAALHAALKALPYRDLRKLHVLMYAGRERDDVIGMGRTLGREIPEFIVGIVSDKIRLHEYLRDGLRLAKAQGVDLEADFG